MFFNQLRMPLALLAAGALLHTVLAVDLHQYTGTKAKGNQAVCKDIDKDRCCCPPTNFGSTQCFGCPHFGMSISYSKKGDESCGQWFGAVGQTTGPKPMSSLDKTFSGHAWCDNCANKGYHPKVLNGCVEPKFLEIDGTWFELKDGISDKEKDELWGKWSKEVPAKDIPESLLKYKLDKSPV
ncbi:hypothetical protein FQN55_003142 [Onygenales sp. PD_40]|nr:hypothetical protein FQN55_003142 [Onygenales sp. PD_40]KAK2785241.1 hypothetical protein FQN52_008578 [Onygenales sp. PD_12]